MLTCHNKRHKNNIITKLNSAKPGISVWYKCTHVTESSPKKKKDGHEDNNYKEEDDHITVRTGTSGMKAT